VIYTTPVDSEKDLIAHIAEAAATVGQATCHFLPHKSVAAASPAVCRGRWLTEHLL